MCVPTKLFSVNGRVLHQGQGELLTGTFTCVLQSEDLFLEEHQVRGSWFLRM